MSFVAEPNLEGGTEETTKAPKCVAEPAVESVSVSAAAEPYMKAGTEALVQCRRAWLV